jgi:hypothetical protein
MDAGMYTNQWKFSADMQHLLNLAYAPDNFRNEAHLPFL